MLDGPAVAGTTSSEWEIAAPNVDPDLDGFRIQGQSNASNGGVHQPEYCGPGVLVPINRHLAPGRRSMARDRLGPRAALECCLLQSSHRGKRQDYKSIGTQNRQHLDSRVRCGVRFKLQGRTARYLAHGSAIAHLSMRLHPVALAGASLGRNDAESPFVACDAARHRVCTSESGGRRALSD
jgi:hypothetical protein